MSGQIGVCAATFILCKKRENSFTRDLATRTHGLNGMLNARIAAVMLYLGEKGLGGLDAHAGKLNIASWRTYPNIRLDSGHWNDVGANIRDVLLRVNISPNLKMAQEAVVGIQESAVMLGVEQVMGAANKTASGASSIYKEGAKIYKQASTAQSRAESIKKLDAFLNKHYFNKTTDLFINAL